jgi:hypothetical protein
MATAAPNTNIRIPLNQFVEPSTGRPTQEWLLWLMNPQVISQTINYATINGGTIDNTVIGGTTPAAGTFTTLTALVGIGGGTF